jgi:hypothetical protein
VEQPAEREADVQQPAAAFVHHGEGSLGEIRVLPVPPAFGRGGGSDGRSAPLRTPLLLLLSGPLVLLLVVLDAPTGLRVVPVLTYLAVVPGLTVLRTLRLADRLMEVLLGIGLSLALGVLLAQLMIYVNLWSPTLGLSALVTIASAATSLELYRGPLRPRSQPDHQKGDSR